MARLCDISSKSPPELPKGRTTTASTACQRCMSCTHCRQQYRRQLRLRASERPLPLLEAPPCPPKLQQIRGRRRARRAAPAPAGEGSISKTAARMQAVAMLQEALVPQAAAASMATDFPGLPARAGCCRLMLEVPTPLCPSLWESARTRTKAEVQREVDQIAVRIIYGD